MTALRRMTLKVLSGLTAALALGLATPGSAQDSDAPIDVTAAPPPSAETIGPSQLQDFNLQGTVTRPAERPAGTPAQPATTTSAEPEAGDAAPSRVVESSRQAASPPPAVPGSTTPASQLSAPATTPTIREPVAPSLPLEVTTGAAPRPSYPDATSTQDTGGFLSLPWIAALVALVGGGTFIAWSRRSRRRRYSDAGRMAFAGAAPEAVPEAEPMPRALPRPDPIPPRAEPRPAPRPDPVPQPGPNTAPKPIDNGLIVSSRLKAQLNVEFHPDRVVVTEQDVLLQFDIVLANVGSAPARDVLVEGRLFTAHIGQDREIAQFFQNPAGQGDRMTSIAPLGRISLKSLVRLPLDQVHHFEAGGRKLFVPMVGFNLLYRSGSGENQTSASFLVGRGSEDDEKLAPFRIDLGPRIFRGLSARAHSLGLQPA